jgi:hypothetical protein
VPTKLASIPAAKCRTGKILAIQTSHDGVPLPNGMKMPDRKHSGRMVPRMRVRIQAR